MMKPQLRLFLLISLVSIALAGIWLIYPLSNPETPPALSAKIDRDCAPWDGPAFTISFPYDSVTSIMISIWQAPSLAFPAAFSFPDETMRIGTAYVARKLAPLEGLSGKVWLPRLEPGKSIEGRFSFRSERGERLDGVFLAEWGNLVVYCG